MSQIQNSSVRKIKTLSKPLKIKEDINVEKKKSLKSFLPKKQKNKTKADKNHFKKSEKEYTVKKYLSEGVDYQEERSGFLRKKVFNFILIETKKAEFCPVKELKRKLTEQDQYYANKLRKLRNAFEQQQSHLNKTMIICLEDEIEIEEKKKRICRLEMELVELKSGFAREREEWSKKVYTNAFAAVSTSDVSTFQEMDLLKVSPELRESELEANDPIKKYLEMNFFEI